MGLILGSGTTKPQYPYDMWYGVEGDFTSKDYKLKRVGNLDLHRTLPIHNKLKRFVENPDGSVKYYLHPFNSLLKESGGMAKLDTTDGNVMLEKPFYYMRFEINGTKWTYAISEYPLPGFVAMSRKTCSPWFATIDYTNNTAVSGCWLRWDDDGELVRDDMDIIALLPNAANFRNPELALRDGTDNSQLGMPRTGMSKEEVRPLCKNGTHIGVARIYNEIAWLQRIEYASLHCQDEYTEFFTTDGFIRDGLGNGTSVYTTYWNKWGERYPFIPCGATAKLGNSTGRVPYTIQNWKGSNQTVQVTSYRGLETPFEYLWLMADDILCYCDLEKQTCTAYGCTDPTKFASPADNSTAIPDGYVAITELPKTEGYIWNFGLSYDGFTFPTSVDGGAASGMCDNFWRQHISTANGWFGCLLGGAATSGTHAGFSALHAYSRNTWKSPYGAFRLCRF